MITRSRSTSAFSLVEVILAMGVVSFSVLSMLGLLTIGLKSDSASSSETAVTNILSSLVSDVSATPLTSPATAQVSPQFGIPVPVSGAVTNTLFFKEDGTVSGTVNQNAIATDHPLYRATVIVVPPASTKGATTVRLLLTWPALADAQGAHLPSKQKGSVETVTAFLRN